MEPFHLVLERTADGPSLFGWPDELTGADGEQGVVLLLGDPFTFPIDLFLRRVNEDSPGLRVLGGMASGVRAPASVACSFRAASRTRAPSASTCRGRSASAPSSHRVAALSAGTWSSPGAQDNLVLELGGKTPLAVLQELWPTLTAQEQHLFQQGLHVGRVLSEYRGEFQRGDFLVRNVLALGRQPAPWRSPIACASAKRCNSMSATRRRPTRTCTPCCGSTSSAHDHPPSGALLFSCNGRGTRLFAEPHHDARVLRAEVGGIPLAGFFAQGELGPVGGQNFIHGFTASVALFEEF